MAQVPNVNRTATTVRLSRDVKLKAALHAVEHGQTLCAFIEQAIRAALAKTGPVRRLQLRESRAFYRRPRTQPRRRGRERRLCGARGHVRSRLRQAQGRRVSTARVGRDDGRRPGEEVQERGHDDARPW